MWNMRMFVSALEGGHKYGTSPFLMLLLMDEIPSKRNSLRDGKIHIMKTLKIWRKCKLPLSS
jgi:hypothetical protein